MWQKCSVGKNDQLQTVWQKCTAKVWQKWPVTNCVAKMYSKNVAKMTRYNLCDKNVQLAKVWQKYPVGKNISWQKCGKNAQLASVAKMPSWQKCGKNDQLQSVWQKCTGNKNVHLSKIRQKCFSWQKCGKNVQWEKVWQKCSAGKCGKNAQLTKVWQKWPFTICVAKMYGKSAAKMTSYELCGKNVW